MRRLLGLLSLAAVMWGTTGCINIYSGDQVERSHELLVQSENLRAFRQEWQRIWFVDQPSHLSPYRMNGAIAP
jgi:hypothetical protein